MHSVGKSVIRKDAEDKVTGRAKYTNDHTSANMLHAKMVTSPYGHALIKEINLHFAQEIVGVRAILTGKDGRYPLTGEEIRDRPPIAIDRVRYYGEVVAVVVADTFAIAKHAADLIVVTYEPMPALNTPTEATLPNAPLIHEHLMEYQRIEGVYPEANTNISNRAKIRKGNMIKGWQASDVAVEATYHLAPSDHIAMETRCATAEILADGQIIITSSSQAPFMIKKLLAGYFQLDLGKIVVNTPLVGGAFGGKASVQLEILAYLASKVVDGRLVKLENSREEDIVTSPCHIGLDAKVKLGARNDGILQVAEILYLFDGGAYSDKATDMSRAAAVDCTGPYNIENVWCDSLCVYTNHPYAAPFRGFSHSELLFAIERTMDLLAQRLNMDPLELRYRNAIMPGSTTPTRVLLNKSNVGNLQKCIVRLKEMMKWDEGQFFQVSKNKVRTKGVSCIWKTSTIDMNASSGVFLSFNSDGSINLMSGVVEIGTGTKTILAQILAEKLKMDINKIHVKMAVNTRDTPEHWKTVASRGTFMGGRAVLAAAEDVIKQLKSIASCVLRATPADLEVAYGRVFLRDEPRIGIDIKDIAYGYSYPNGNAIGGQILGAGHYILRRITVLDKNTGAGNPGPEWTVGAQGVEVEFDTREYTYRILKAYSVIDIGKVINPKAAKGQVMGGMNIGLSFGGRETFLFDENGRVLNPQLRTYRPIHYGENPEFIVDFVETPQLDAAYGARGVGEHGVLGMPAALGNSLSLAVGVPLNLLPLTPEYIWRRKCEVPNELS